MSKNINLLIISICLTLCSCVGPPNYTDGLIENVPAIINENDFFSLSLLGDKYSEETKWDLSLSTTDLDKILTTMIVKDLSVGASDSSYLYIVDEEGDTILSAGLFSELIFKFSTICDIMNIKIKKI